MRKKILILSIIAILLIAIFGYMQLGTVPITWMETYGAPIDGTITMQEYSSFRQRFYVASGGTNTVASYFRIGHFNSVSYNRVIRVQLLDSNYNALIPIGGINNFINYQLAAGQTKIEWDTAYQGAAASWSVLNGQTYYLSFSILDSYGNAVTLTHCADMYYPFGTAFVRYGSSGSWQSLGKDFRMTIKGSYDDTSGNNAPICTGVTGPANGQVGVQYQFTASGYDPDGDTVQYSFRWSSSGTWTAWQNSASAYYSWGSAGTYAVNARMRDSHGAIGEPSPTHSITITTSPPPNNPPTCTGVSGPTSAEVGQGVTFTVSGNDPDNDPIVYKIDFGDGTTTQYQSSNAFNHQYSTADIYDVKGMVRDSKGAESSWSTAHAISVGVYQITVNTKDAGGIILTHAQVSVSGQSSQSSGDSGTVTFPLLSPGNYAVSVSKQGYETWETTATLPPSQTISSANVQSVPGIIVTISVKHEGLPVSGAYVILEKTEKKYNQYVNAEGVVTFTDVEEGNYTLTVKADGYSDYTKTLSVTGTMTESVSLVKFDLTMFIIAAFIAIIIFVIFLIPAIFRGGIFRFVFLILGIIIAIIFFLLIMYWDSIIELLGV